MKKIKANHEASVLVEKREEFQGSSLRGEAYDLGLAPWMSGTWLDMFEVEQYDRVREHVTYIVWSFYTPIAYYIEGSGWYKVGMTFSSYTSRHRGHALNRIPGHLVTINGTRGNWNVVCRESKCWPVRHFTREADARRAWANHR